MKTTPACEIVIHPVQMNKLIGLRYKTGVNF